MNLAEITHRAYFLDCYPLDERHLKISIQTGKDVDEVILWAGDPYSAGIAENEQNWQGERVPMEPKCIQCRPYTGVPQGQVPF